MKLLLGLGSCGIAAGALEVEKVFSKVFQGSSLSLQRVGCNGMCFAEPLLQVITDEGESRYYGRLNADSAQELASDLLKGVLPDAGVLPQEEMQFLQKQTRIALRHCGLIDPENIDSYLAAGGYKALEKAFTLAPEEVIEQVLLAGLRGRGGAGFGAATKWQAARNEQEKIKYIVCNADEGDPGAFMDRSLCEGDPHSVLQGIIIAGYAVGAQEGLLYVRAEYPLAVHRLQIAVRDAEKKGFLGKNILGSGFDFTIRVVQGAGAFVCGEETALLASLEGKRGMPQPKPPYPAACGYKGKPTVINNVETFANVPWILENGPEAFAAMGTSDSKGTKVFALAGKIKRGGLVEVPMGITLGQVVMDIGGGTVSGRPVKAVQIGGPSGGCLPASLLDTPIDYAHIGRTGAIMGSGGLIVIDDSDCIVDMARFFMEFCCHESCGKCPSCRIGTQRMKEMLEKIIAGKGNMEDLEKLNEMALAIRDGSLCGLGSSAPNPVLTTMRYFPEEYEEHIKDKRCTALQCRALLHYAVKEDECAGCGLCADACPSGAISEKENIWQINKEKCNACGLCCQACPNKSIHLCSGEVTQ